MKMQRMAGAIVPLCLLLSTSTILGNGLQSLHGHVPPVIAHLRPLGEYPRTNRLHLAISLPLRNQGALSNLLAQIYDPASPNYRHYLTSEQFTAEFGPSEPDYQAVIAFANSNGLHVTMTYSNRVLVDVEGSAGDIERSLHTTINVYRHPTENRNFYAPAKEPSLDLSVPILRISGLDNYELPRPHLTAKPIQKGQKVSPNLGSGPDDRYIGLDFRAAYVPDSSLDGSGQCVGLLEFDGFNISDISYYEKLAGLPGVIIEAISVDGAGDGANGPTESDGEVALDMDMAISMATNLSLLVVYIAPPGAPFEDILNQMAGNTRVKQFSNSWYIPNGPSQPAADQIWEEMAAQGQSFFSAAGDSDAYTNLISFPADSPYITQVGGTILSTAGLTGGGPWSSETVWNDYDDAGTGGGISTQYPIPSWQTNISMTANQGSTTMRNTPDVAIVAQDIYVRADGSDLNAEGTSCAAPLWAGFAALVNQQAAAMGTPPIGLINAAADAIGTSPGYTSAFHDITNGDNTSDSSPNKFYAVPGYDLCSGWGTPNGQNLINALINPPPLVIMPDMGIYSTGKVGGPFTVTSEELSLTNTSTNILTWSLSNTSAWLAVSSDGGVLTPGGPATTVRVSLNTTASNLALGTYSAVLWFTNLNNGLGYGLSNVLNVIAPPTITTQPTNQAALEGAAATFSVAATGGPPLSYQWQFNGCNLTDGGNISGSQTPGLTVSDVSTADVGNYSVTVTNLVGMAVSSNAALTITPSSPVIVTQPASQVVMAGQTAEFSVSAVGNAPFSYQWNFNGANIPGATNATLTLTNVPGPEGGNYSVTIANAYGSTNSISATLTVDLAAQFFDDFNGPALNPIWQASLPNAACGWFVAGEPYTASYIGAPNYSFGLLDSNTVVNLDSEIGFLQRVGWSSSTNFQADNFRYEARFNTMALSSTTNIDGFFEIWIMNATNDNLYDIVSPFAGNFGTNMDMFFDSSVDFGGSFMQSPCAFADNTWYRLVLQCLPGQRVHASLCDDNERELAGFTFSHDGSAYGAGFKIVLAQSVGGSGQPGQDFPTDVAVNYASLTSQFSPVIVDQPQNQMVLPDATAAFSVVAQGPAPLSYQWTFDGADIAGATNAILTLTNVQAADQGTYSVLVTNSFGSVLSSNAMLTVTPRPSLTIAPNSGLLSISWTTNSAGFVLVTTTNLESGNWAPVTPAPVQIGNQYYEVVSPAGTSAFYRLQFEGN